MITEIREKIFERKLRIVDEDSTTTVFNDDIFVINFTEKQVTAGKVLKLPAKFSDEWDNIRRMIIEDNFEDLEILEGKGVTTEEIRNNMKIVTVTAEEIKNLFTETEDDDVEFTEEDEEAFRENVASMVTEDLEKLNTIRLGYYENFTSNVQYQQQLFNDTFVDDCIDEIVDAILENDEAYLSQESAKGFVDADIDYVAGFYESIASDRTASDSERSFADKIFSTLCHYDLDKALALLEKGMSDFESMSVSFDNVAEVLEAVVKPHGNGARVNIPKKYVGKNVKIVILSDD